MEPLDEAAGYPAWVWPPPSLRLLARPAAGEPLPLLLIRYAPGVTAGLGTPPRHYPAGAVRQVTDG